MTHWLDRLHETAWDLFERALDNGVSETEIANAAWSAAETAGRKIADGLVASGDYREHAKAGDEDRTSAAAEVADRWQRPLELLSSSIKLVDELCADFHSAHPHLADDPTVSAVTGLTARIVRGGREVSTLLAHGYPVGALTLARSMHECAVVSLVLAQHREQGLASRFLEHATAKHEYLMRRFDQRAPDLGHPGHDAEDLAEFADAVDDLENRYGRGFLRPMGWAAEVTAPDKPGMEVLENLVHRGRLAPWRDLANVVTHADAAGDDLNRVVVGGHEYRIIGPESDGLLPAARLACSALGDGLSATIVESLPDDEPLQPSSMILLFTALRLLLLTVEAFEEVDSH